MGREFLKTGRPLELQYEVAGLHWLQEAHGARIVSINKLDDAGLHLEHLDSGFHTPDSARDFGSALALTHRAGAPGWGAAPPEWDREIANKGLMPMSVVPNGKEFRYHTFGTWLVEQRLVPVVRASASNGDLPAETEKRFERLYKLAQAGEFDTPQPSLVKTPASRLHGDLWAGNLMWTAEGVTLIDPSAYGGHAETDLAECGLFGTPFMQEIYEGYNATSPLAQGWEERIDLHRLYMLTLHLALFGAGYLRSVETILQHYV